MLKIFLLVFSLMINFSVVNAMTEWHLPQEGLQLEGKAKQDYIKSRMDVIFKRTPGESHPFSKFETPTGWEYKKFEVDGVKVESLENPSAKTDRVILNLHGGGYVLPLDNGYRNFGFIQGVLTDAEKIFLVDYRTAPKYVYPAALEDAVKVYKEILNRGTNPKNIIVTGDSAGGNLALELSIYLKENKIPQPKCLILLSPWANAENNLPSRKYNATRDLILGQGTPLHESIKNPVYAKGFKKNNPSLSPIYADLKNLPPMLIQVGSYEMFLDECFELAKKATADNVKVVLSVYPEMSHDFALLLPELQESVDSFREIKYFVEELER